jgi:tetratricopeptide (TPR) repeat protein
MKAIGAVFALFLMSLGTVARADDAADCQSAADPAKAVAACTRIIDSGAVAGRELAVAYYGRGNAHDRQSEVDQALADLRQAVAIDPKFVAAWNDLGLATLKNGDAEAAIADFGRAIGINPQFGLAYSNRGLARQRKGERAEALADFDKAIALDPGLSDAYDGRGVNRALAGEFDKAIADYDKSIALDPGNFDALNNRGDAYRSKGDFDRALADVNAAIALRPDFAEGFYTRGETYKAKGENALAVADLKQAIALDTAGLHRAYGEGLIAEIEHPPATKPGGGPPPATGVAENRVALVIGNSVYQAVGELPNPVRDADAIAAALRTAGFTSVTILHNLDRAGMVAALKTFGEQADKADWAVVYYAGHGLELGGVNYMVPVDAKFASDRDVPDEGISLDRVMTAVEGAKKLRLIVVDACRNNPFLAKMKVTSATRAIGRGLALVEPSQATLVAYAAKAGSLASDGDGVNSPFAASLARRLVETGVEINKVFRLVRNDVLTATNNDQEPFVYGSLPPDDFYFVPPKP